MNDKVNEALHTLARVVPTRFSGEVAVVKAEIERLEDVQKRLSTSYITLFIDYVELMDESLPEWRHYARDSISNLQEALKDDVRKQ